MLIKIISIDAGWFELDINRHWILKNSDFLDCDAPKLLLQALLDVSKEHAGVRWLCWQGEPGAEILRIEKDGAAVAREVFCSERIRSTALLKALRCKRASASPCTAHKTALME